FDQLRGAAVDVAGGKGDAADRGQPGGADALGARLERRPERAIEVAPLRAELHERVDLGVRYPRSEDLAGRRRRPEHPCAATAKDGALRIGDDRPTGIVPAPYASHASWNASCQAGSRSLQLFTRRS